MAGFRQETRRSSSPIPCAPPLPTAAWSSARAACRACARPAKDIAMRNRQAGFNMLEILFSLLIVTTGLLGLAGTQVIAQRAEQESYQRAQAIVLMTDIVDRINTNRKAAICYNISDATTGAAYLGATCSGKYN